MKKHKKAPCGAQHAPEAKSGLLLHSLISQYPVLRFLTNLLLVLGRYLLPFGRARKMSSVAPLRLLLPLRQGYSKSLVSTDWPDKKVQDRKAGMTWQNHSFSPTLRYPQIQTYGSFTPKPKQFLVVVVGGHRYISSPFFIASLNNGSRKIVLRKIVPRKLVPRKLYPGNLYLRKIVPCRYVGKMYPLETNVPPCLFDGEIFEVNIYFRYDIYETIFTVILT